MDEEEKGPAVEHVDQIDVFTNGNQDISIVAEDGNVVCFHPRHANAIIKAIREAVKGER